MRFGRSLHLDRTPGKVLAALLVVGVVAFTVLLVRGPSHPAASGPRVLLITGGSLSREAAEAAVDKLDGRGRVVVHPLAGISHALKGGGAPLAEAVRTDGVGRHDDVVVVQGGEADNIVTAAELRKATYHLLDFLIAHASERAAIVLVGPIPGDAKVPASLVAVNATMKAAAEQRRVQYVDAIAARWTVADSRLGVEVAGALESALRNAGLVRPSGARTL